ncbi:hypothetical protein RHGRI_003051 [Rhododendron griersonianum]|uniref:RING-type domain-containing protein n=1 Tax=Rhododendron griersonianum TaxID=479676 RepID=A0AAV6LRY9_9ERIC|nr:hypothetical protein RHGRI_003051 [Rhododendron griersonianum]
MDDPNGDQTTTSSFEVSSVSCSICLDFVTDDGTRATAKLQCGHEFHLDCIGSAFNSKGAMQCPNCRKVEKGRWLYATGSTFSFPEFSIEDWTADEDLHELSYSEMPSRVHWCPFSGVVRVHSSFEEVEPPPTRNYNLHRHHSVFSDQQTAASPVAHSYVAYFGPIPPPTTSNTSENVEDPNFNHPWNGLSGHNEIFPAHTFPVIGIRHQNRGHHSHPFSANSGHVNSADQASIPPAPLRSTRGDHDALTRSGSVVHPFLHGPRSIHSHQRMPASHATHHHQHSPVIHSVRRFHVPRGVPPAVPAVAQSDHTGGFFLSPPTGSSGRNPHDMESSLPNHFHAWERDRDPAQGSFHHASGGSDNSNRLDEKRTADCLFLPFYSRIIKDLFSAAKVLNI